MPSWKVFFTRQASQFLNKFGVHRHHCRGLMSGKSMPNFGIMLRAHLRPNTRRCGNTLKTWPLLQCHFRCLLLQRAGAALWPPRRSWREEWPPPSLPAKVISNHSLCVPHFATPSGCDKLGGCSLTADMCACMILTLSMPRAFGELLSVPRGFHPPSRNAGPTPPFVHMVLLHVCHWSRRRLTFASLSMRPCALPYGSLSLSSANHLVCMHAWDGKTTLMPFSKTSRPFLTKGSMFWCSPNVPRLWRSGLMIWPLCLTIQLTLTRISRWFVTPTPFRSFMLTMTVCGFNPLMALNQAARFLSSPRSALMTICFTPFCIRGNRCRNAIRRFPLIGGRPSLRLLGTTCPGSSFRGRQLRKLP